MDIFHVLLVQPIFNFIVGLYHLLGDNLALAIIVVAIVSRVVMIPLMRRQLAMAESSKEFSEKTKAIKKKYKKNKEKQQQELLKLQQEYLPAQLGGCLPMIFQIVVFIVIYQALSKFVQLTPESLTDFNSNLYNFVPSIQDVAQVNFDFLGLIDVTETASNLGFSFPQIIPYLILILGVGVANYFSFKLTSTLNRSSKDDKKEESKKKKDKDAPEDFGEIMQQSTNQALMLMPILYTFFAYALPAGLAIYLLVTSVFVIIQKLVMDRNKLAHTVAPQINKES